MRVLMVNDLPLDEGAGTEVYVSRLIAGLREAGDEVAFFTGSIRHRGAAKLLDLWDPRARRALADRAAAFRPDVVHHHHVLRELSVSVLGIPRAAACALTVHDLRLVGGADRPPESVVDRAKVVKTAFDRHVARKRVDAAMAVSAEIARRLRSAGFRGVEQVPVFCSDAGPPGRLAGAASDVVFVGRITPDKGAVGLVTAFGRIASRHPGSRLVFVGDGSEREVAEKLAARVAPGQVEFAGWLPPDGVLGALARARVVAVPSLPAVRAEGMPLAAVEAAMSARPLVVSDDPGLVEMVAGTTAGIVTPAGSVDALADALDRILGDPDLADRMGAAARELAVNRFSPSAGVRAVRQVYARIIAAR